MPDNNVKKITAAIDYIEGRLTQPLDLDGVAEAVHYSKYYLHRTFSKLVGMTIHDYIQRLSLIHI